MHIFLINPDQEVRKKHFTLRNKIYIMLTIIFYNTLQLSYAIK